MTKPLEGTGCRERCDVNSLVFSLYAITQISVWCPKKRSLARLSREVLIFEDFLPSFHTGGKRLCRLPGF
jgi:hypothetical protein